MFVFVAIGLFRISHSWEYGGFSQNSNIVSLSSSPEPNGKWLIIKLDDERSAEILPYEKAKEGLAQNLAKKAVEDFVSQGLEKPRLVFWLSKFVFKFALQI